MTAHDDYFQYLQGRSFLGHLYRRFWLYPSLCRHLQGRVLDIGCGLGDMLAFRPDTIGVDINTRTVDWCVRRGLDARPMEKDRLPFADASFDGVLLDNVLEHIEQPAPLLAEIKRVLKPGGVLLAGVPGQKGFASDPDHKVYYDKERLIAALDANGYVLKRCFARPFGLPLLGGVMRQYCLYALFTVKGQS